MSTRGHAMLVGAGVLAMLVLFALLAERSSDHLWYGRHDDAVFYCAPCDLRYRREELSDQEDRVCPRGHYVDTLRPGFSLSTAAIAGCVAFLVLAAVLTATGVVPVLP